MLNDREEEKTGFQEVSPYNPTIDLRTDFVMAYGIDDTMPLRVSEWKNEGYVVHLMTGIAWGEYQDYLYGKFDGRDHWDEAQKDREGKIISHGVDVPYMVPTLSFTHYLVEKLKVAVDSGVVAIHLEEPEFWVEGGYSEAFKREWEIYYKEEWTDPHISPNAQYRASKLKAFLYKRCISIISAELKEYSLVTYNSLLRIYIPTHSLINYTQWRIVSPQSQLLDVPTIDGYIAQIWTGTSRTMNVYNGIRKERTFETAFLEYGIMQELIRNTDRKIWFLQDPIEDNPTYNWEDYEKNYRKTLVASLFHPAVSNFEVVPWPNRVFNGKYKSDTSESKIPIPKSYSTTLLIIMNTLRNMKQDIVEWQDGIKPIGIALSDTAMYQRSNEKTPFTYDGTSSNQIENEEEIELLNWSAFYGLALPPLKIGIPVRAIQMDNISRYPSYLNQYDVLVLSYEFFKPQSPNIHYALSEWVQKGGQLVYVGDASDSFHKVTEWWNSFESDYESPVEHLFEALQIGTHPEAGTYNIGKGKLVIHRIHPQILTEENESKREYLTIIKSLLGESRGSNQAVSKKNHLLLRRGPYVIASVLDETTTGSFLELNGLYVDLFDSDLNVTEKVRVNPGEQILLYDLEFATNNKEIEVIATSARIEDIVTEGKNIYLSVRGPVGVEGRTRILTYSKPKFIEVIYDGQSISDFESIWDSNSHTTLIKYHLQEGIININIQL